MKTPQVIYIGAALWSEKKLHDRPVYFSEEAVRNALMKAYTHANLVAGASQSRAKECARIRVDNVINEMKGGEE